MNKNQDIYENSFGLPKEIIQRMKEQNLSAKNSVKINRFFKRKDEADKNFTGDYYTRIFKQIEWTRQRYGIPAAKMAYLLGVGVSNYKTIIRRINEGCCDNYTGFYMEHFMNYCYIFGYDIESLNRTVERTKEIDDACITVANSLYSFDLSTLILIKDGINDKMNQFTGRKNLLKNELDAIEKIIACKKEELLDKSNQDEILTTVPEEPIFKFSNEL